jgi:uncharacterized protein
MIWLAILALGLAAGTIGGIVGFGSSIMLMPALMLAFGPQEAVPIMAIAALMANLSRVAVWWREVDWRANAYYCATAVPAAALGARTLLTLDPHIVEATLGVLFFLMAGIGFLAGMVASTGPINTPFFIAYGLVKGAYLSTEAVGSIAVGLTKTIVFQRLNALSWETAARGLIIGTTVMAGSWVAKGFVLRLEADQFRLLMDALLILAGMVLLWGALTTSHA